VSAAPLTWISGDAAYMTFMAQTPNPRPISEAERKQRSDNAKAQGRQPGTTLFGFKETRDSELNDTLHKNLEQDGAPRPRATPLPPAPSKTSDPRYIPGVSEHDDDMTDEEWFEAMGPVPEGPIPFANGECTECGEEAEFRYANIPNGYRTANDGRFCAHHAAKLAADGKEIEEFPQPLEPGEKAVWLIEGDDHEYVKVEATSEEEAIEEAAGIFEARYDDDDDDDDDEGDEDATYDVRDSLTVAGVFRGEGDGYSDELEFVPYGDIDENRAYGLLAYAD